MRITNASISQVQTSIKIPMNMWSNIMIFHLHYFTNPYLRSTRYLLKQSTWNFLCFDLFNVPLGIGTLDYSQILFSALCSGITLYRALGPSMVTETELALTTCKASIFYTVFMVTGYETELKGRQVQSYPKSTYNLKFLTTDILV